MIENTSKAVLEYKLYQLGEMVVCYNVWGDSFDTPSYNTMSHKEIECIRFMAENDVKSLTADGIHFLEISSK